jgi:hypothetical protein
MNREQTEFCHFSTTEGTAISHIPQQFYPICCGEDSGSGDVLARVKIRYSLQELVW